MFKHLLVDYWKNAVILVLLLFICCSCDITKKSAKSKTDTDFKEEFVNKTFRKGDSVSFRPGNLVFKDTTIYRVSKENTTVRTVYDQNGNIRDIDCYASRIEELTRRNTELQQGEKNKQQEKIENFDSSFILYIIGGIVVLGLVALLLLFVYINKNFKVITSILTKIS